MNFSEIAKPIILSVLIFSICGCATMTTEGDLAPTKTTKIEIGMTQEQVKRMWGAPNIVWYPSHQLTEYEKRLFPNPAQPKYHDHKGNPDEAWYYAPNTFTIFPQKGWDILFKDDKVVDAIRD